MSEKIIFISKFKRIVFLLQFRFDYFTSSLSKLKLRLVNKHKFFKKWKFLRAWIFVLLRNIASVSDILVFYLFSIHGLIHWIMYLNVYMHWTCTQFEYVLFFPLVTFFNFFFFTKKGTFLTQFYLCQFYFYIYFLPLFRFRLIDSSFYNIHPSLSAIIFLPLSFLPNHHLFISFL